MLLHGWPYDIHSFVDVAPLLAAAGYRVIVPHLRGHGTTHFLSSATFRNAQQAVVALDIIALMDALKIDKAVLAGYDWGARTEGRARLVVPVLLCHRARPGGLRGKPARIRQSHLEGQLAEVGFR